MCPDVERERGGPDRGALWSPGWLRTRLALGRGGAAHSPWALTESWETLLAASPGDALAAEPSAAALLATAAAAPPRPSPPSSCSPPTPS